MANEKRLIDAAPLIRECDEIIRVEWNHKVAPVSWADAEDDFKERLLDAPVVDAIPIAVIKRAIAGINAADQCDQAGRYDFELRNALKTVLEWYGAPAYKECERRAGK